MFFIFRICCLSSSRRPPLLRLGCRPCQLYGSVSASSCWNLWERNSSIWCCSIPSYVSHCVSEHTFIETLMASMNVGDKKLTCYICYEPFMYWELLQQGMEIYKALLIFFRFLLSYLVIYVYLFIIFTIDMCFMSKNNLSWRIQNWIELRLVS